MGSDKELIFWVTARLGELKGTLQKHNQKGSIDFGEEIRTIDQLLLEAEKYLTSNPKSEVNLWATVPSLVNALLELLNKLFS